MKRKRTMGNKIIMVVMALMMIVTVLGVSGTVFAGNTGDKDWSFNLSVDNTKFQYIYGREKLDSTKTYISWQSAYGGNLSKITVSPYGADSATSTPKAAGTSSGGTKSYVMNGSGKYSLTSYVYELGYGYARPGMKSNSGKGTAKGVWSPDSVGTYTILQ